MASVPPGSPPRRLRVAVLFGGPSAEREVSLWSGTRVLASLDPARYEALPVEITAEGLWLARPDLVALGSADLRREPGRREDAAGSGALHRTDAGGAPTLASPAVSAPASASRHIDDVVREGAVDVVFIALHGTYGEDGTIQGLLELLGIPYTGSGVLASALAMDKLRSRQILQANGVPVPGWTAVEAARWPGTRGDVVERVARDLGYPCVVKPNAQGSSIGVTIVQEEPGLDAAVEEALRYGDVVLIEEYLCGTELTCAILEDRATGAPQPLPLIEIVPKREFFNYEAKYAGASEEICPARVPAAMAQKAQRLAVRTHQLLGCEGLSRTDLYLCGTDVVVLELNTIPGLAEGSLIPLASRTAGMQFPELVDRVIAASLRRDRMRRRTRPRRVPEQGPGGGHAPAERSR